MASQQETNLVALGKAAYEARVAVRGAKAELARELGFANGGALSICADRVFYGKVAPSRQSGSAEGAARPPRSTNTVSALRQALEDMKAVGLISDVPSLHIGPVDSLTVNPEIARLVQPFFDAQPLNAAFMLAFRHVPTSQLKEFGITSPEMREAEKAERQAAMDKELAAKDYLRSRGFEIVVADSLRSEVETWSLRLIESSNFEIGLLHQAEQEAALAEQNRLAALAAAAAAEQAARLHDAETVAASQAMDASERERAALAAAEKAAAETARMKAEIAAMREQMAQLLAASKPAIKAVKKAA